MWNDTKNLDLTSARAMILDKKNESEMSGHLLGLTLPAPDLIHWVFAPVLLLVAYSGMLRHRIGQSEAPEAPLDWPTRRWGALAIYTVIAICLSLAMAREGEWFKRAFKNLFTKPATVGALYPATRGSPFAQDAHGDLFSAEVAQPFTRRRAQRGPVGAVAKRAAGGGHAPQEQKPTCAAPSGRSSPSESDRGEAAASA